MTVKQEVVRICVSPGEKAKTKAIAEENGYTLSAYIRNLIRIDAKARSLKRAA